MAESLLDRKRQAIVASVRGPEQISKASEVRIDPGPAASGVGPQESGLGLLRDHHIAVIAAYDHVDAMRAHIFNRGRKTGRNLALHIDVPLFDVTSLRIAFRN